MSETKMIGTVSELSTMLEYARRGYTINLPTTPARYDFIAEKDGRSVKVQVKHGSSFNNGKELLGHTHSPYKQNEIDIVAIYDSATAIIYFIPASHVDGMTSIRLRLEPYSYQVDGKALVAEHYLKFIG